MTTGATSKMLKPYTLSNPKNYSYPLKLLTQILVADIEEETYEKTPYYKDYQKIEDARVSVIVKSMSAHIHHA